MVEIALPTGTATTPVVHGQKVFTGVSIVIPYYNDVQTITQCLKAIRDSWEQLSPGRRGNFEVILVDDNSLIPFEFKEQEFDFQILRLNQNLGVGNVRNKGAHLATFSHVQFVDSDVLLSPHYLSYLFDRLEADPGIKVLQGPFSQIPANMNPSLFQQHMALSWFYKASAIHSGEGVGTLLSSGCTAIEKDFFEAIGGFVGTYKGCGGEEFEIVSRMSPGTIVHDDHLLSYHYYDSFAERLGKSFKRAMNYRVTIGKNQNIPSAFKVRSGIKAICGLGMSTCYVFSFFHLGYAIATYLFLGMVYCLVDAKLLLYIVRNGSWGLAVASVFFSQLEYALIALAMLADLVGWNTNVQQA